ncbi:MAG: hypothetical protein ABIH28_01020 [archaeon]
MTEYAQILREMEESEPGFFGDNPDPVQERYERFLVEKISSREIRSKIENPNKLEISVGSEISHDGKKRKRTLSNISYKEFYKEASVLSRDISLQTEDKIRLLLKYYSRFGDKGVFPIRNIDSLKIGSLFNNVLAYSKKRMNQ